MGLDMYAWTVPAEKAAVDVDLPVTDMETGADLIETADLHYWRKHPDLHGWMRSLYYAKGGKDPVFNCNSVRVTVEDLDRLEADVRQRMLAPTTGFFFGRSEPEDEDLDRQFIAKARAAIASGLAVYYDSWW